jgi:hypothetical protein
VAYRSPIGPFPPPLKQFSLSLSISLSPCSYYSLCSGLFLFGRRTTFERCREWEPILAAIHRSRMRSSPSAASSAASTSRSSTSSSTSSAASSASVDVDEFRLHVRVPRSQQVQAGDRVVSEAEPSAGTLSIARLEDWNCVLPADALAEVANVCGVSSGTHRQQHPRGGQHSHGDQRSHLDENPAVLLERLTI